jgi:hypothetical protein
MHKSSHGFLIGRGWTRAATLLLAWYTCLSQTTSEEIDERRPQFSLGFGSCLNHRNPAPALLHAAAMAPDAFVFLGDNVYVERTVLVLVLGVLLLLLGCATAPVDVLPPLPHHSCCCCCCCCCCHYRITHLASPLQVQRRR